MKQYGVCGADGAHGAERVLVGVRGVTCRVPVPLHLGERAWHGDNQVPTVELGPLGVGLWSDYSGGLGVRLTWMLYG